MEKADFLQEGAQGLLRALRLFDVGRGVAFSTYAVWHIRAFVLRAVRDKGRLVRLPQALQHRRRPLQPSSHPFPPRNPLYSLRTASVSYLTAPSPPPRRPLTAPSRPPHRPCIAP